MAVTVTIEEDTAAGVPEIMPVTVSSDRPAGSAVELKLVGLLVAVIV